MHDSRIVVSGRRRSREQRRDEALHQFHHTAQQHVILPHLVLHARQEFVVLLAEEAYNVLTDSADRARRHRDTLANLRFAALKLDALGMRYLYMQEMANYYATALQHQKDNKDMAMDQLGGIEEPDGGRLEDLREYTTRLRELYKDLWLSENHANWLPNMLQLYDRQSLMWQDMIARIDGVRSDFDQGKPLPPAETLGLMPGTAK